MRPENPLIKGEWTVSTIPLAMGIALVQAHHYARGAANTAVFRHGLFHRDNPLDCRGAALWIPPAPAAASAVSDDPNGVLALSRLVIDEGMPTNAASFLLGRSIRLIRRDPRWHTLVTYADEGQGHHGGIYLATNWEYDATVSGHPVFVDDAGRMVSTKAGPRSRTIAEMAALGYTNRGRSPKRRFVKRLREVTL